MVAAGAGAAATPDYLAAAVSYIAAAGDLLAASDVTDTFDYFTVLRRSPRDALLQLVFEGGSGRAWQLLLATSSTRI